MDVRVFLQAQDWLLPDSNCRHHEPPVAADASSKKPKLSHLKCKSRFHICLDEQQTAQSSTPPSSTWCGLLASGAVNIRLRLPDGTSKATLDATVNIPQQQHDSQQAGGLQHQPPALQIGWYGQQFAVCAQHILKVVCSAGVAAAAASQDHGSACLLAPPVVDTKQQYARVQWVSLITQHVCLDIMVPDKPEEVRNLGRVVHALHTSASCCTNPAQSAAPAPSSSCATDLCSAPSSTTPPLPVMPSTNISSTQPTLELDTFLTAATCEAQLIQMLLDSQSAASENGTGGSHNADVAAADTTGHQHREQHLLDAVANVHASQHGCIRVAQPEAPAVGLGA